MSDLVEARLAGAEGVGAVGDAVRLVPVAALGPVAPAVVQLGVWAQSEATPGGEWTETFRRERERESWDFTIGSSPKNYPSCIRSRRSRSPRSR